MNQEKKKVAFALLRREILEYRNSFVLTPLVVAGVLILCMLASVLLANRITVTSDSIIEILNDDRSGPGMNIVIRIDEDKVRHDYVVSQDIADEATDEEDWNFSREWTFDPQRNEKPDKAEGPLNGPANPVLNGLHNLFLLLMLVVSINYLLGTFFQDRRDRSVLFWKSMPVSEAQEVAAKVVTVSLLAPVIYLTVSWIAQVVSVGLAMLITWRVDMAPVETILDNVDFVALFRGQLSGLMIWVLWTAPFYAWLLLCSCAARRSPLLLAAGIPIALIVLEKLFVGSDYLMQTYSNHIPHIDGSEGGSTLGFFFYEPQWLTLDYLGMLLGLVVAAGFLTGAIWFRKHRFEI